MFKHKGTGKMTKAENIAASAAERRAALARKRARINDGGFDVVVERVIGRVEFGAGDALPEVAAFKLIGEVSTNDGEAASYSFPGGDGRTVYVNVEYGPHPVEDTHHER